MTSKIDLNIQESNAPYNPNNFTPLSGVENRTDQLARASLEKWKENVVNNIALGLRHIYIDASAGERMASVISNQLKAGKYEPIEDPSDFKNAVVQDMKSECPDKHLDLIIYDKVIPHHDPDRSLHSWSFDELTELQKNYINESIVKPDFSKVINSYMIPETQIGYLKINEFTDPILSETATAIDNAMKGIMAAKGLIIDLRENNGGSPVTVALVASYFHDKKQLINQLYERSTDQTDDFYAEPEKLTQTFGRQKPVYILTSNQTFSGGEELAYDLQSSRRAKVIGQTTGGGAHPVRSYVVDDYMFAVIPKAKAINPYTGSNWEGTGVQPDFALPESEDALEMAKGLLLPYCG